jgi:hypothetical protein
MIACVVVASPAVGQTILADSISSRAFDAVSNNALAVTGSLTLSTSAASFAKLRGTMQLRFDGTNNVSGKPAWFARYYQGGSQKETDRQLFAR